MLIASLVVAMADAGRADEGSQREWMLQGEEVRGVGDLPSRVVCEKVETAFAEREGFACIDGICPRLAMSNDEDECGTATSGARTTDSVRLYELEKP